MCKNVLTLRLLQKTGNVAYDQKASDKKRQGFLLHQTGHFLTHYTVKRHNHSMLIAGHVIGMSF